MTAKCHNHIPQAKPWHQRKRYETQIVIRLQEHKVKRSALSSSVRSLRNYQELQNKDQAHKNTHIILSHNM